MIDSSTSFVASDAAPWSVPELEGLVAELAINVTPGGDADTCLAQVEVLEALKSVVCAAQVRATEAFSVAETARVEEHADRARREGRHPGPGAVTVVAAQVGLARRVSPARGRTLVEGARALVLDLPQTLVAMTRGEVTEERALLLARETEHLPAADRGALDAELVRRTGAGGIGGLGTEQLRELVQRLAMGLDSQAEARRRRKARDERRVTGRLLGDGTGRITAVVGSEDYANVLEALGQAAATARTSGDSRTSGQVRSDTLVQRITGLDPTLPRRLDLHLVVSVSSLFDGTAEPGWIPGGGSVPSGVCRDLVAQAAAADRLSVRRLFALPEDGQLIAMEQSGRTFNGLLARLIRLRDGGTCRTPWCDAPIKHLDHVQTHAEGGRTSYENAQGLCETCNQVKETPGWAHWTSSDATDTRITITTPAGRRYTSRHRPHAP